MNYVRGSSKDFLLQQSCQGLPQNVATSGNKLFKVGHIAYLTIFWHFVFVAFDQRTWEEMHPTSPKGRRKFLLGENVLKMTTLFQSVDCGFWGRYRLIKSCSLVWKYTSEKCKRLVEFLLHSTPASQTILHSAAVWTFGRTRGSHSLKKRRSWLCPEIFQGIS